MQCLLVSDKKIQHFEQKRIKQWLSWKLSLTVDWKTELYYFSPIPLKIITLVPDLFATPLFAQVRTVLHNFKSDFFVLRSWQLNFHLSYIIYRTKHVPSLILAVCSTHVAYQPGWTQIVFLGGSHARKTELTSINVSNMYNMRCCTVL